MVPLLIVLALGAVAFWYFQTGGFFTQAQREAYLETQLYHRLLQRTHGDRALAERLIAFEHSRHRNASRAKLIQFAIERLEWDNW